MFSLIPQRLLITPDRLIPICQLQRTQELNLHPVTNYWMKDYDGYHTNQTYEIKSSLSPFRHFDFWNDPIFDFALNTQLNFYFNDIVFKKKVARGIFWLPIYYVNTLIMMDLSWISFFRTTHQWRMKFAMWEGFGVLLYYSIPEYGISDGLQICCCHKWKAGVIDKWFAAGIGLTAQCLQQFCYRDLQFASSKCHNIGSGRMHHRNNFC